MDSVGDSPEPMVGSYYDSASGKSGSSLKNTLHEIIDDHTGISKGLLKSTLDKSLFTT
ncbi:MULTISPECIES: hypothetical protein [unclassified Peribacillus]|uniref:hypothetical protein n=1 Tax=unclassified Peribacillus TaxID=2675266 RepID=UPI001E451627|nr:hypothetical protein [Peribacillus sp. Bi96]